jgi:hypothetical protein
MNIHQVLATVGNGGVTPKDIGTCEVHMGQHKKQKDCKFWKTIAPAKVPR